MCWRDVDVDVGGKLIRKGLMKILYCGCLRLLRLLRCDVIWLSDH